MTETSEHRQTVARVVSVRDYGKEVIINRGARDGIKIGDKYLVYGIGEELFDPETNETLGRLETVRGRGYVFHLQDRIATLRSSETERRTTRTVDNLFMRGTTYDETPVRVPFSDAEIGDYAKPI